VTFKEGDRVFWSDLPTVFTVKRKAVFSGYYVLLNTGNNTYLAPEELLKLADDDAEYASDF
jgi:hypothetical protein